MTIPMEHTDEDAQCQLHSSHVVLQECQSKVCTSGTRRSCQGGGAEVLLSHCDHTTLVKADSQPSPHFWAGFMFNLGGFLWPHVLLHPALWGLGVGAT